MEEINKIKLLNPKFILGLIITIITPILWGHFSLYENLDKKIIDQAEKIKEKIIQTALNWQNSGYAEKLKNAYLKGEPLRYFGGKILK